MKRRIDDRKNPNWQFGEESKRSRWDFVAYLKQLSNSHRTEQEQKQKQKTKQELIVLLLLWGLFTVISLIASSSESISTRSDGDGYFYLFTALLITFISFIFAHTFCNRFSLSWDFLKIRMTKQILIISIIAIFIVSSTMIDTYLDFYNMKLIDLLPPYNKQ